MTATTASAPVERKVTAATLGAGAGAIVGEFVNWTVDQYVITPGVADGNPAPVSAIVTLVCAALVAFASGYAARHTGRPDLTGEPAGPIG